MGEGTKVAYPPVKPGDRPVVWDYTQCAEVDGQVRGQACACVSRCRRVLTSTGNRTWNNTQRAGNLVHRAACA